jgi:hypothetical protein
MKRQTELPEEMQTDDPERVSTKPLNMEEPQSPYSVDLKDETLEKMWDGKAGIGLKILFFGDYRELLIGSAAQSGFWSDFRYFVISAGVGEFLKPIYKPHI